VLTAGVQTEEQGEPNPREAHQEDVREHEHGANGQFRYLPADSYTDGGELRVYTQPFSPGARLRSVAMMRTRKRA